MDWKELGTQIAKTGAPVLGSVIGGPAGNAIGKLVATLFGADPQDPGDIYAKLSADPDALVKLKELEAKHKERITELYLADIQSARSREVAVVGATGKHDYFLYGLATVTVVGFYLLLGLLMKWPIPEGSNNAIMILFGSLATGFGTVLAYFFGSSKSSSDKTRLMAAKG